MIQGGLKMVDVFEFSDFESLMDSIKKDVKQAYLADILNVSSQKVHVIFKDSRHQVYPQVGKWRGALKLKRPEGDYFELLCIIHSYPSATEIAQLKMLRRAFHLAMRLEDMLNPAGRPADSVVYWLDPLVGILRDMTELHGFPREEKEIPRWVTSRITYLGTLGRLQKNIPPHIRTAWSWLKKIGAVRFSINENHWVKSEPNVLSRGRIGKGVGNISSGILTLAHINTHHDFIHELPTTNVLGSKLASFVLPSAALDLLDRVSRDFLFGDLMRRFNYVVNLEDRERLRKSDPEYYAEVVEYERQLVEHGYEIPHCSDADIDTAVQIMFSIRRLTNLEPGKTEPNSNS